MVLSAIGHSQTYVDDHPRMEVVMTHRFACRFSIVVVFGSSLCAQERPASTEAKRSASLEPLRYHVEAAPEWTGVFDRREGLFGTDGIFSIPWDGADSNDGTEETLLVFSDSYIGEVGDDEKPLPGNVMVNNCTALLTGLDPEKAEMQFVYPVDADGKPQTMFVPGNAKARPGQYYWLGDGFVNKAAGGKLYVFAYHVEMTGPGVFDFAVRDVSLIAVPAGSRPPFVDHRQLPTPLHVNSDNMGDGDFGAAVLVNTEWAGAPHPDGFVYVYACLGEGKNLAAARVDPERFEEFSQWRFWNGTNWDADMQNVAAITDSVSNELSVTPLPDGRYLLIFQVGGLSDKVGLRIGASPVGPFGEIQEIWTAPEAAEGLLTYNAKAHPALSRPGELLISYNTITLDFWNDIQQNADIYRPRFFRLVFE